jgi:hypothetical protein
MTSPFVRSYQLRDLIERLDAAIAALDGPIEPPISYDIACTLEAAAAYLHELRERELER